MSVENNRSMLYKKYKNNSAIMIIFYSFMFFICTLLTYSWFYKYNRVFVFKTDGIEQHLSALIYYGKYLRNIISEFIYNHKIAISLWDFSLGYGSDVFNTLHYYVIGDPFALLSVFVPVRYTEVLYCALCILRAYTCGIVFYFFSISKNNDKFSSVIGALNYSFCGYVLYYGVRHPYFINALIFLPLIMIGIDKIFENKRPTFYIVAVAMAAISNFYFFYIICILMVIYAVFEYFYIFKKLEWKNVINMFLKFAGYFFTGIFIASFMLIPVIYATLNASRMGNDSKILMFYDGISYYIKLFAGFVTTNNSVGLIFGFISLSVPIIILLFLRKKQNTVIKIAYLFVFLLLSLRIVGTIMNGFSYSSLRYCFILSILVSFTIAKILPEIRYMVKREKCIVSFISILYASASSAILNKVNVKTSALIVIITVVFIVVLADKEKYKNIFNIFVLAITCLSIAKNAYLYYSMDAENYIQKNCIPSAIDSITDYSQLNVIKEIKDNSFYRSEAEDSVLNTATAVGIPSTAYYYSLINNNISKFMDEQGNMLSSMSYKIFDMGKRSILESIFSVKYYVTAEGNAGKLPYGFNSKVLSKNGYAVYQNDNFIPFGFTYSTLIRKSEYDDLTLVDRQYSLLQGAVVDGEYNSSLQYVSVDSTSKKCDYKILSSEKIKISGNKIIVKKAKSKIKMEISGVNNSELYLNFKGFKFSNAKGKSGKAGFAVLDESGEVVETFLVRNLDNKFYSGTKDYCINTGYIQERDKAIITLQFNNTGTYEFDSMSFQSQPLEQFTKYTQKLKESYLNDIEFDVNRIYGNINIDDNKMLCLSIPYTSGWTAYVNGEKKDTVQIATMFTGIELEKGTNNIELRYFTPGLRLGICLSIMGLFLLIGINIKYQKRNNDDKH